MIVQRKTPLLTNQLVGNQHLYKYKSATAKKNANTPDSTTTKFLRCGTPPKFCGNGSRGSRTSGRESDQGFPGDTYDPSKCLQTSPSTHTPKLYQVHVFHHIHDLHQNGQKYNQSTSINPSINPIKTSIHQFTHIGIHQS